MEGIIEEFSIKLLIICGLLGAGGQFLRSLIGFYKIHTDPVKQFKLDFNWTRLIASLVIGMFAGMVCSLLYKIPLSNTDIMGIVAASYAGTDWLEGMLVKKSTTVEK